MSHHCHITWPVYLWQRREHLLLWYEHASLWQVWASACCRFMPSHTRLQGINVFWSVLSVRENFTQSWLAVFSLLAAAVKRLRSALACRRKEGYVSCIHTVWSSLFELSYNKIRAIASSLLQCSSQTDVTFNCPLTLFTYHITTP